MASLSLCIRFMYIVSCLIKSSQVLYSRVPDNDAMANEDDSYLSK